MTRVFAIGEVLWDMLPTGKKVGGAPGNFAYHCRKLGAEADMISRVGNDELGHELLAFYQSVGLSTEYLVVDEKYPTGAVDVELASDGQPQYVFRDDVAWDHLQADAETLSLLQSADAICYGTLACRTEESFEAVKKMIHAAPQHSLRVYDVNLRPPHYAKATIIELLALANMLKLNDEELPIVGQMLGYDATDTSDAGLISLARQLLDRYQYKLLILTMGERGSILMTPGETSQYRSRPVQVVDTVGAGDAFTAATILGFLDNKPLEEINKTASDLAARVCTHPGAMTPYP